MNSSIQIPVYDNVTIDITKYPRVNTPKHLTDIIMITFLLHQDYLKSTVQSFRDAITFYNECKEYYYLFKTPDGKDLKKFSAKEIIYLVNQSHQYFNRVRDIYEQQKYVRKYSKVEQYYLLLIKNQSFYQELFYTVQDAKYAYFQRREINYKLIPPFDFYGDVAIPSQVYTAQELLEMNAYVQYLLRHKIIKELPEPLFVKDYFNKEKWMEKKREEEEKRKSEEIERIEEEKKNEEIKTIYFS